jgi:hypothetical protein
LDNKAQENAETTDRILTIKANARVTLLGVANLTLEYAASHSKSPVGPLLTISTESCDPNEGIP